MRLIIWLLADKLIMCFKKLLYNLSVYNAYAMKLFELIDSILIYIYFNVQWKKSRTYRYVSVALRECFDEFMIRYVIVMLKQL